MRRALFTVLVSVVVVGSTVFGQHKTGDQAAKLARKVFVKSVEGIVAERRTQCMSAFGQTAFCDCISGYLPITADFQMYIMITTTPPDRLDQLSATDKNVAYAILTTRDQCVAAVFGSRR